ncbi:MAG: MgtC/SapB family protein [Clostridium sp.]
MKMVAEMITKIGIPSDAELFLRVIVASVLGYMIGYERKNRDKSAGMRTHAIVALGAALMMVVSKYGFLRCRKGRFPVWRHRSYPVSVSLEQV